MHDQLCRASASDLQLLRKASHASVSDLQLLDIQWPSIVARPNNVRIADTRNLCCSEELVKTGFMSRKEFSYLFECANRRPITLMPSNSYVLTKRRVQTDFMSSKEIYMYTIIQSQASLNRTCVRRRGKLKCASGTIVCRHTDSWWDFGDSFHLFCCWWWLLQYILHLSMVSADIWFL